MPLTVSIGKTSLVYYMSAIFVRKTNTDSPVHAEAPKTFCLSFKFGGLNNNVLIADR